jgi:hypothetical protein
MSGTSSNARYGKTKNGSKVAQNGAWKGFVDIPLSEVDKDKIRAMSDLADDVMGNLVDLVERGLKVTLSLDDSQGTWIVSGTGKLPDDPNYGYTLVARGGSLVRAVNSLTYKVFELAQGGVWANVAQTANADDVS